MLDLHIFVNAHDVLRSKRSVLKARQSSVDYHEIAVAMIIQFARPRQGEEAVS
ncbi:MAG: hypothetical protein WA857_04110 [Candidatus Acidiferrum sp.]